MSNRIDRSLGVKPYSNHDRKPAAPQLKERFGLKKMLVIVALLLITAGAVGQLNKTNHCVQGVRCAD